MTGEAAMDTSSKLKDLRELLAIRADLRLRGQRLVFTNGCFELLHVGHVRYLQGARALGDVLMVGLNSDLSVRTIKGPPRPLVPESERAEMLAALACVDYVVIFDQPTAESLVGALRPDVYVKGGDYAGPDQSDGHPSASSTGLKIAPEIRVVQRYGGRVVILPYTSGHSTTELIERIRASTQP